jgi:hypothetical protein
MGVEGQCKRNEEVVRVPECFVCLLPNTMMSSGIHQHHAQEHDVACDTSGSCEMDLNSQLRTDLIFLDVVEAGGH